MKGGDLVPKVPQTTTPLTKSIRTIEGVLVALFNLAMLIVPIVTNALPPATAAKYAMIANGILVVSRTALKMMATLGAPAAAIAETVVKTDPATGSSSTTTTTTKGGK